MSNPEKPSTGDRGATALSRRGMFAAAAGAVTAVTLGGVATTNAAALGGVTAKPPEEGRTELDAILDRARAVAAETSPLARPDARTATARVGLCRAWDHQVYLIVDEAVHGFAAVDARAFALLAAAQLTRREVAIQYWGHRDAGDGTGAFDGVMVAADVHDLPHHDAPFHR